MRSVFISYSTVDRSEALAVCEAIERRGVKCWIACRDVQPGENYQEAIVRAIRNARAMVLVFSEHANNSDEIKKELSLVSRFRVPMMALRIEDVEPSDAFAYELATRQWIDLFADWDKSLDSLVRRVDELAPDTEDADPARAPEPAPARPAAAVRAAPPAAKPAARPFPVRIAAIAAAVLLFVAAGAWWFWPHAAAEKSMEVRLLAFNALSKDVPAGMTDALRDEIIAAFSDDGIVTISTAAAPPAGTAPAYALGGSVQRDGDQIRVITRLTNERSGATLWSNTFSYPAGGNMRVPRRVAVAAGNVTRCGLFGASTYPRAVPDPVLANYIQACATGGFIEWSPTKALDLSRKVVAALPDFSWGWSGLAAAARGAAFDPATDKAALHKEAIEAADKAIKLDPSNSEALVEKSGAIDPNDLIAREALFKRALAARALACGCEHHVYGNFLEETGHTADAIVEFRRGVDVLALSANTQASLAFALINSGKADEAKEHVDAAIDLSGDPRMRNYATVLLAPSTGDFAGALVAIRDLPQPLPPPVLSAWSAAFQALNGGSPAAKAAAAQQLVALPAVYEIAPTNIALLGALGANGQALKLVETFAASEAGEARRALFRPSMAGARADPAFAPLAEKLGLFRYWRASKTRPDLCKASGAPAWCGKI